MNDRHAEASSLHAFIHSRAGRETFVPVVESWTYLGILMKLSFAQATENDAEEIALLRNAAADALTRRHGEGSWSWKATERSVLRDLSRPRFSRTIIARDGRKIVATLCLQTKKPWAIDIAYFTPVEKALYLINMAVDPARQREGL